MIIRRKLAEGNYPIAPLGAEPANILEKIVWVKEQEVQQLKLQVKDLPPSRSPVRDFRYALLSAPTQPALIAEVKRASPSKGVLRVDFDPVAIAQAYVKGGASCLSVLTDSTFFQGSFSYLSAIRGVVSVPLLCKEFIIDPAQIYWARHHGADAILLITAILDDDDLYTFHQLAHELGMAVLVEVHSPQELERVLAIPMVEMIGINNRNLTNFTVDLRHTEMLLSSLPASTKRKYVWVSESGIYSRSDLDRVTRAGARAVLVGESLVKQTDLVQAIRHLYAPA